MKNDNLYNLFENTSRADTIVLTKDSVCNLIIFNDYFKIERFGNELKKKRYDAYIEQNNNLLSINGDTAFYQKNLLRQLKNTISNFTSHNGFLIHKNLSILDADDNELIFDELPVDIQNKISAFISIQKSNLIYLTSELFDDQNSFDSYDLDWLGKKTDFFIISTLLKLGGYIGIRNSSNSKKEVIIAMAKYFNVDVSNYKILLNKALNRENSTTIIDKLKSLLSDLSNDLLN